MHKAGARRRWKRSIHMKVDAVPGSIVRAFSTLVYRLRGEGYEYDQETDHWYRITEEDRRVEAIQAYQAERREAKRIQDEDTQRRKTEAREKAARGKVKLTTFAA